MDFTWNSVAPATGLHYICPSLVVTPQVLMMRTPYEAQSIEPSV